MPPEVTVPQTVPPAASPPSMWAVMATTSASNLAVLGQRSGWSGLDWDWRA